MNARTEEKRTSILIHKGNVTPGHRVGARQRKSDPSLEGGGYLNFCSNSQLLKDEKKTAEIILAELREMGLRRDLLQVAEKIGADNFLQVWKILETSCTKMHNSEFRVSFPRFGRYVRFQRDLFIRKLADENKHPADIQKELLDNGFELSLRQVRRLAKEENEQYDLR